MTLTFPVCPWVFAKKHTKIGLYFHFFPGWVRDSENEVQRDNLGAIWGFSGSFPMQVLILLPKHSVSHSPKSIQPSYPHITYLTASKELGSDLQNEKRGELLFSQKTTFRFVKRPFSQVSFFLPGSITVSAYFFIYKWHKKLVCNSGYTMPSIRGMTQIFGDSVPGTTVRVRGLLYLGSAGRLRSFLSCCFRFAREFCCPEPEMKAIFLRLPGFWALLSTRKYTNTFLDYAYRWISRTYVGAIM